MWEDLEMVNGWSGHGICRFVNGNIYEADFIDGVKQE